MRAMIIPGNGNCDIKENWYFSVKSGLEKLGLDVIAVNMPDPDLARMRYWIPFIEKQLKGDSNTILIGHSSGAVAVLRFLETHKAQGAVLVGVNHTDLGMEKERVSGYYDEEWQWNKIKQNANWIAIFASTDDPYIPVDEPRLIKDKIGAEYYEYTNQGHFGSPDNEKRQFPKLVEVVGTKIKNQKHR